eukprot:1734035-Prymnesium_polylepis.1
MEARTAEFVALLRGLAHYLLQSPSAARREEAAAVGAAMLGACVLVLETATVEHVGAVAAELAADAEALCGLQ